MAPHPTTSPHTLGRIVHTGFNAPTPTKRKRRLPIVPVLVILLLVGAGAGAAKYVLNSSEERQEVVVQTPAFTFTLPDNPTVEPLAPGGLLIAGSQWTVESGSEALLVIAMDFGSALDEVNQQATFDRAVAGGVGESGGTVTSDTWVVTNGAYVRDTIIALPDGMLYMKGYGKGAWAVFLMGATAGSKPPPGFASLVGSFSFADVS